MLIVPLTASAEFTDGPMLDSLCQQRAQYRHYAPRRLRVRAAELICLTVADWVSRVYFVPYCSVPFHDHLFQRRGGRQRIAHADHHPVRRADLRHHHAGRVRRKSNTYIVYIQRAAQRQTHARIGRIHRIDVFRRLQELYPRGPGIGHLYAGHSTCLSFVNETYYIYEYPLLG